jgi:hypothetical protein
MTIKIEIPADRKDIALAIGKALTEIGQGTVDSVIETGAPVSAVEELTEAPDVDEKGVPFNAEFCGKATIPFYGSGKKKGQWKKRQGIDQAAYDEWYAKALPPAEVEVEEEDSTIAASLFAASDAQPAVSDEDVPQDAGQLMRWVSEQQVAGNITQQQVTDAYTALQLPFDAVMSSAHPVADNCAAIYNHLKEQIS